MAAVTTHRAFWRHECDISETRMCPCAFLMSGFLFLLLLLLLHIGQCIESYSPEHGVENTQRCDRSPLVPVPGVDISRVRGGTNAGQGRGLSRSRVKMGFSRFANPSGIQGSKCFSSLVISDNAPGLSTKTTEQMLLGPDSPP